jgi:flagellin
MSLNVNTNIAALNGQRNLSMSQASLATSMQRLSSGLRINSAKDDAAGLSISERFSAQIRGNDQAQRNANDGISLAQTAEGDLEQITNNLQRIRELAVQSANATNSSSDRASIDNESKQLIAEIDRVAANSSFNGTKLLDGSFNAQKFQVGANNTANDSITIAAITSARTSALGGSGTSTSSTTTSGVMTGALTAGALTLNGTQVGASSIGAAAGQSASSAFSIAAAINAASSQSGVTATANATAVTGAVQTGFNAYTAANSFSVNGINVGAIAAGGTAPGQGANVAAAINSVSAQSGVTATADDLGKVTLTAADGRDITLLAQGTTTAALALSDFGLVTGDVAGPVAAVSTVGTITLNSNNAAGIVVSGGTPTLAGLTAGTTAPSTTLTVNSISSINLLTASSSTNALSAIDGALSMVNASRASLGSYQNRFESTISSLQTTTENLTAARGRIRDADFAKETANLSRSQVLQQAGTAMLAQANQSAQGVLSLLR